MSHSWNEDDIQLALQAFKQNQKLTLNRAAKIYNIPCTTLRNRQLGLLL
jgi:hypothetical protein